MHRGPDSSIVDDDQADLRQRTARRYSSPVPSTTSIWTGLVAALAAILGVLIAQAWTTRREDRNWQRQLQLYTQQWEDQQLRDAEQRKDQHLRDADQRQREDRHRFTEYKRDLYAELLSNLDIYRSEVGIYLFKFDHRSGPDRSGSSPLTWLHDNFDVNQNKFLATSLVLHKILLVAPHRICQLASEQFDYVSAASRFAFMGDSTQDAHETLSKADLDGLREEIRRDLAINSDEAT